ncbi:putative zinc finger CCHC domain-containing protein 3-like [Apostichopus japonicus]|uniref:Putative zinc finger CCHC domain-containing protein 3-like n=1 Tax=Stichopus japonicus TaxID=307972 RepID=A0A2G8KBK8_STIJA|nr:putative zinc finger CCHC domain-containing protein 3-like [Apostichopus japonicus]
MASRRDSKIVKLTFTGEQAVPPVQVFSILKSKGVVVPGEVDALQALQGRNTYDVRFTSDVTRQKGVTLLSGVEGLTVTPYERSVWVTVIHVGLEVRQELVATVLGRFGAVKASKMCSYAQAPGVLNGHRQVRIDLKQDIPSFLFIAGHKAHVRTPVSPVPASDPNPVPAPRKSPPASPINSSSSVPSPPPVSPDPETLSDGDSGTRWSSGLRRLCLTATPGLGDRRAKTCHWDELSDAGITELDRFTSAHLLADVWRHMHPCSTVYTWVRPNGEDASRIDRVYAPVSFTFSGCETLSCPLSDHDTVVARFVLPSIFPIGRGLWKLNCRILGEAEFRQGFETRYKGWQTLKPAFASTSQWWDDVKLRIKRYAIQYCVTRARRRREKFSKLCAEVKFGDPLAVIALQTYLDEKYHGARVRARVEAVEAEERPSLRFYQSVSSSAGDRRVPSVSRY